MEGKLTLVKFEQPRKVKSSIDAVSYTHLDVYKRQERTFANILRHYSEIKKYDTGIFATDVLTRILFERGESELAISLLTSKEEDTFYSRMKKGGTTIPEYWTGHRSQCHPLFGAVSQ